MILKKLKKTKKLFRSFNGRNKSLYHLPWFLIFIFTLFIYTKTMLPTVGFWDVGEAQTIPYTLDIAHPTGFPTYIILGKIFTLLFPFGSIAWRLNFFSAFLISSSLVFLYLSSFLLTKNRFFSAIAALNFAFGRLVWRNAVQADVHNLNIFFASLIIYLLLLIHKTKKFSYFYLLSFLAGLSLGNHPLSIFNLPAIFLLLLFLKVKKGRFSKIGFSLLFFLLGTSIYFALPIIARIKPPLTTDYSLATWQGFLRHVSAQDFRGLMGNWLKNSFVSSLSFYLKTFGEQFHPLFLLLALIGLQMLLLKKSTQFLFLALIFVSVSLFTLNYQNAVIERYFLTPFLITSLFSASSLRIIKKFPIIFSIILISLVCLFPLKNLITNYKIVDQSKNYSALSFAKNALFSVKPNSLIISWWSYSTPLWYLQKVENKRKDVQIVNASQNQWENIVQKNIREKTIYLVKPINFKNEFLKLEKEGNLYRVTLTQ